MRRQNSQRGGRIPAVRSGRARPIALAIPLAVTLLIASFPYCGKKKAAPTPPSVPVVVATARVGVVPLDVRAIGSVEASATVSVRPRVSGPIERVHFTEGQLVEAGDVLFTLDQRPFVAALHQAESVLARDAAQSAYNAANAQRYQSLVAAGVASREQAESIAANARALAATVGADRAAVESSRIQLDYCTIRAPIGGRTGSLQVRTGNLVQADVTALVVINSLRPVFVTMAVPEEDLPEIQRYVAQSGLPVSAAPTGEAPEEGTVTFVDNSVDPTTGTIRVRGTFPNADQRLWPGQFVEATMQLTARSGVVVPTSAVQIGQSGAYVFVIRPELVAELRPVTTSASAGDTTLVDTGVEAGETVVTDGQIRLVPGTHVTIVAPPGDAGPEHE